MLKQFRKMVAILVLLAISGLIQPGVASAAVPGTPVSFTGSAGHSQVALSWGAVSAVPSVTNYLVEYSADSGMTWVSVVRTNSTSTSHTVTGLTNGTTYWIRVTAVNGDGDSSPSGTVVATPFSAHTENDLPLFSACPVGAIPAAGFGDVSAADIDCIKYYGITTGTTATTYSPFDPVPRWQMALFLTRLADKGGSTMPDGSDQGFADIGGYSSEIQTAINQLKQLGVTVGKTATTFAPDDEVIREEMALFVSRLLKAAKAGPGGNTEFVTGVTGAKEIKSLDADHNFTDLGQSYLFETQAAIVSLWNLGATDVQNVSLYDPKSAMTRRAMAAFMAGALHHTNARPAGLVFQASTYRSPGTPTVSFSVTNRTVDLEPIVGASIDTFKFTHTGVSGVVAFDTIGRCSAAVATSVGNSACTLDASDPKTDSDGNLTVFTEVITAVQNSTDLWAWTGTPTTIYDNDLNASGASMITVVTTG